MVGHGRTWALQYYEVLWAPGHYGVGRWCYAHGMMGQAREVGHYTEI